MQLPSLPTGPPSPTHPPQPPHKIHIRKFSEYENQIQTAHIIKILNIFVPINLSTNIEQAGAELKVIAVVGVEVVDEVDF